MDSAIPTHQSDPLNRTRLRWRARRGLLENDLIVTRFLDRHELNLSDDEVGALTKLFELSDNDLLDILLARKEPTQAMCTPHLVCVLEKLRAA
jgi:antitoxin CptB